MNNLYLCVPAMLALAGCPFEPSIEDHAQADLVIAAYERDYSLLSENDKACMHDFSIRYVDPSVADRRCAHAVFIGCFVHGPFRNVIFVQNNLAPMETIYTIRHELTHLLLQCVALDSHGDHQVPEFGYSGVVSAPDSIAVACDTL